MTERASKLLDEFMRLSEAEREEFITAVNAIHDGPDSQADIDEAWRAEIARRLDQYKVDGRAIPWDQVRAKMRASRSSR